MKRYFKEDARDHAVEKPNDRLTASQLKWTDKVSYDIDCAWDEINGIYQFYLSSRTDNMRHGFSNAGWELESAETISDVKEAVDGLNAAIDELDQLDNGEYEKDAEYLRDLLAPIYDNILKDVDHSEDSTLKEAFYARARKLKESNYYLEKEDDPIAVIYDVYATLKAFGWGRRDYLDVLRDIVDKRGDYTADDIRDVADVLEDSGDYEEEAEALRYTADDLGR